MGVLNFAKKTMLYVRDCCNETVVLQLSHPSVPVRHMCEGYQKSLAV